MFLDSFFDETFLNSLPDLHSLVTMRTDIQELPTSYIIEMDMPGYKKEEISVTLNNRYLVISAKHTEKSEEEEEKGSEKPTYLRKERHLGECQRSIYLEKAIDVSNIKAKFNNGVLILNIPKLKDCNSQNTITIE